MTLKLALKLLMPGCSGAVRLLLLLHGREGQGSWVHVGVPCEMRGLARHQDQLTFTLNKGSLEGRPISECPYF